jgi:alkylation response protein AidB-like acyl-CoA dehydrogenase
MIPHRDEWIASPAGYPKDLHEKAYKAGVQGVLFPNEWGGTRPDDYDAFHEMILWDEFSRCGGHVMGQLGINSMALPPIIKYASDALKEKVVRPVVMGKKQCSLAISEPTAGSDVANIKASATLSEDGSHYVVNGQKKWITGGATADFFTLAVRTSDDGPAGISLLLLERDMPGVSIRKMKTQFDTSHSTTFITLDDVKIPRENLIGEEGSGFLYLLLNFNHERLVIATGVCRGSRMMFEQAFKYALKRKTFGKKLVQHQLIRFKLAEMARQIEMLQDAVEAVTHQFAQGVADSALGGQCALLKVNATKTFEYCCREASQIFGGAAVVREGQGELVERAYRDVRGAAIPGGSEEILLDFAIRSAVTQAERQQSKV